MKIRRLGFLVAVWLSLAAFSWPFTPVPLHTFSFNPLEHAYVLKPHNIVTTFYGSEAEEASLDEAIAAWNFAAGYPDFVRRAKHGEKPNIYINWVFDPRLFGEAICFPVNTCFINISRTTNVLPHPEEVYAHELGHTFGFAHNPKNLSALMTPFNLRGTPKVDPDTVKTLRFMLSQMKGS